MLARISNNHDAVIAFPSSTVLKVADYNLGLKLAENRDDGTVITKWFPD